MSAPFELCEPLLRAVAERNYHLATAVQAAVIPRVLEGRDVLARAHTGSGKTAAYVLPCLEAHNRREKVHPRPVRLVVVVPTRELAAQATAMTDAYGKYLPNRPKTVLAIGGVSINPQMMELRGGADIVVGTPGRLLDLVSKNALDLRQVGVLVLDEADRLLDLGFSDELGQLMSLLPMDRQTLMFSATFPDAVATLAESLLRDPVQIDVREVVDEVPDISQRAIEVDRPKRTQLLRHLLTEHKWNTTLVFVATIHSAEHVSMKLCNHGFDAWPLHGKLSQGTRTRTLDRFRRRDTRVLVATDLAARGLDIAGLSAVVNYDLPRAAGDYVHRIGRTGRAGEQGVAVSFVTADTHAHFQLIEKRCGLNVQRERIAGFEPNESLPEASGVGGVKGKRMSKKDKLRAAAERDDG
jgi:ATP-dependent RNA helicase RhlE